MRGESIRWWSSLIFLFRAYLELMRLLLSLCRGSCPAHRHPQRFHPGCGPWGTTGWCGGWGAAPLGLRGPPAGGVGRHWPIYLLVPSADPRQMGVGSRMGPCSWQVGGGLGDNCQGTSQHSGPRGQWEGRTGSWSLPKMGVAGAGAGGQLGRALGTGAAVPRPVVEGLHVETCGVGGS